MTRAYSGSHDTGVTEVLLVAFYNSIFWELIKEKEWGQHGLSLLTRPKEATAVVIDAYSCAGTQPVFCCIYKGVLDPFFVGFRHHRVKNKYPS